ncbi:MAG: hypothetical protein AAF489_02000 [Bacteroidota bacterium]
MRKAVTIIILTIIFSCQSNNELPQKMAVNMKMPVSELLKEAPPMAGPLLHPEPYELKMEMSKLEADVYELKLNMLLYNGSYYVSPNAKRDFKGKFTLQLDESEHLIPASELVETPRSVEEYDPHPFVRGNVNWVRQNTKYSLRLKRNTKDYFVVKGFIQFTIEPRCTLEKIPIIIKNVQEGLRVELFGC